jgi:bifunctional non-homologous end joining protein LigD
MKKPGKSRRQYALVSPALDIARDLPGIRTGKFPGFIEPALAELRPKAPSGARWVHEVKYDGYRFQLHKTDAGTRMFTRRGLRLDRARPPDPERHAPAQHPRRGSRR